MNAVWDKVWPWLFWIGLLWFASLPSLITGPM